MDRTSTDKIGRKWKVGQCLSCDDVGPISPESLVDGCNEDRYLEALDDIREYYLMKISR